MRRYSQRQEKVENENVFVQRLFNQCIVCCLILVALLILNLVSPKNFRSCIKNNVDRNITLSQVKNKCKRVYEFVEQKFLSQDEFTIDEKILEQINAEENKINAVKKNLVAPI